MHLIEILNLHFKEISAGVIEHLDAGNVLANPTFNMGKPERYMLGLNF